MTRWVPTYRSQDKSGSLNFKLRKKNIMSQRYSGKSRKDSSTMKKSKLSPKEKRKLKRENKKK